MKEREDDQDKEGEIPMMTDRGGRLGGVQLNDTKYYDPWASSPYYHQRENHDDKKAGSHWEKLNQVQLLSSIKNMAVNYTFKSMMMMILLVLIWAFDSRSWLLVVVSLITIPNDEWRKPRRYWTMANFSFPRTRTCPVIVSSHCHGAFTCCWLESWWSQVKLN